MAQPARYKYVIVAGKIARWEQGFQVTYVVDDVVDMTVEIANTHQDKVRLATQEDIDRYEAKLRGDLEPAPIPVEHVSTAGAPPHPTPAVDPQQPVLPPGERPQRHFPEHATATPAPATPAAVPAAQPATTTFAPPPTAVAPAAPAPAPDGAGRKKAADGVPKARTGKKTGGKKKATK